MRELANRAPARGGQHASGWTRCRLTVTHGEGGGSGTGLGLDDLCKKLAYSIVRSSRGQLTVTTELDSLDESLVLLAGDALGLSVLAEQGDNGDTRVTTDDGHVDVLGVSALDLANESGSSDNVEGGNTEESLLVKDTGLLEDLGEDGDGRVDWVGDDQDEGLWRVLGNSLGEVSDDGGVGVL